MDQKLDSGTKRYDSGANEGTEQKGRRLDLSVPQVAGSALAAIAAAVLASQLDVYGTIIGAGVVSVIATCGGSFFHYFFRRTGEQLRDAAAQARPRGRQVPVREAPVPGAAGRVLPDTMDVLGAGYGTPTTHRTRRRGWKRPVLGAVVVFALAMVCITGYELAAGHDLGGNARTTIGSVMGGPGGGHRHQAPSGGPSTSGTDGGGQRDGSGATGGTGPGASHSPGGEHGTRQGDGQGTRSPGTHDATGTPTPRPSTSGGAQSPGDPTPTPTPTPLTSTGTGADGGAGTSGAPATG
ncbi:hypothetical protein [Streptomyces fuscigenes]|uniref:hypothetical protein n=1 Tax=Streptomyces fuscigenes TaxID=1528880 RepID=UPI001F316939|nr:hypothetical protein [Streptomyces fuscigenes]MCF3961748.1 hypothetical protein [Streptomyces fuscigenes]